MALIKVTLTFTHDMSDGAIDYYRHPDNVSEDFAELEIADLPMFERMAKVVEHQISTGEVNLDEWTDNDTIAVSIEPVEII